MSNSNTTTWTTATSGTTIRLSPSWTTTGTTTNGTWQVSYEDYAAPLIPAKLPAGKRTLGLPDGSALHIDDLGNYRVEDKDAKVVYKANRIREFSPHLNASDMLAQFVRYVGTLGVRQGEVLQLPIELFINWLVISAAERDQDVVPADVVRVEDHRLLIAARRPKCLACGRFIPRLHHRNRFPFCGPEHGGRHMQRMLTAEALTRAIRKANEEGGQS